MSKPHSAGPWFVETVGSAGDYSNPIDICEVRNEYTLIAEYVMDRDAHLIAAAPDMLEALEGLDLDAMLDRKAAEAVKAAIAKARGGK